MGKKEGGEKGGGRDKVGGKSRGERNSQMEAEYRRRLVSVSTWKGSK